MQPEYEPDWVTEQLAVLKCDWYREYFGVAKRNAVANADAQSYGIAVSDCKPDAISKSLRVIVADHFRHSKCDTEPQHDANVECDAYSDAVADIDA